jgi:enterochelin esterase-like enzyme
MQEVGTIQPAIGRAWRIRRSGVMRLLAAAFAIVWFGMGVYGVALYVHRYWLYRGFPPPVTPAGIPAGRVETLGFWSRALHQRRHYIVYLPPHYRAEAAAGRRFPVMYLLHAPPGRADGFIQAAALTVDADVMTARHDIRPMIFVLPNGKSGTFANDTEWANARAGPYESFVMDVVHNVDRRLATLADRQHRGIGGLSEGGYGAVNIALHHLRDFSVVQSWSGYFTQTPTASFAGLSQAALDANSPSYYLPALAPRIRRVGLRVFLYQGIQDRTPSRPIQSFSQELYRAGAYVGYGFYPGGHDWGLWRHQMPHMLRLASAWFSTPPTADRMHAPPRQIGRTRARHSRFRRPA